MNTSSHPLPFELKAGEELLWSVDKQPHLSTHMGLMWGASVLLLVLAGVCAAMDIAGNADGLLYLAALLLVLAILAAGTAVHERSSDRRIAYALSNRRAFIIERPAKADGKPVVFSFAVRPQMIFKYLRRGNGHMDYYLGEEKQHKATHRRGFINLTPEQDPACFFEQLGITLPAKGEKRKPTLYERPEALRKSDVWGRVLALILFAAGLLLCSDDAILYLTGQETTATIVDYEEGTESRGRRGRREVTVFYPVVHFTTADGKERYALSRYGYDKAPAHEPGAQIPIIYDAAAPSEATIKDDSILHTPAIMALGFLWIGWGLWKQWRTLRQFSRQSYILVEVDTP
ncbi:MAG: DUF3592 domain-containing protein [Akkermansia sp.]|nr:DUF3592 domain-containing protein [Akkermansia sp.]